jgi:hypothetical protein
MVFPEHVVSHLFPSHLKYIIFNVHVHSLRDIEFTKHDGKSLSVKEANAKQISIV